MDIYYCCRCNRILTGYEIAYTSSFACSCGNRQYTGANPSNWYLIKTFQLFRVYRHALYYHLIKYLQKKRLDNA